MVNFLSNLFEKKDQIDVEKLTLASELSVQYALADTRLIRLATSQQKLALLQSYFEGVNAVDITQKIDLSAEIENLTNLIAAYQNLLGERFYLTIQNNCSESTKLRIEPFILFPLVQNAIEYGYNSLEKYPIRIKLHLVGNKLKFEVSNRVNHHIESQRDTTFISNFEARLKINYPDKYMLLMTSNTMLFKATLLLG